MFSNKYFSNEIRFKVNTLPIKHNSPKFNKIPKIKYTHMTYYKTEKFSEFLQPSQLFSNKIWPPLIQ